MRCGVVLVVVWAEPLPCKFGLGGCDLFAVPGGVPLLLCYLGYLLYEFGELLGFGRVELCSEFCWSLSVLESKCAESCPYCMSPAVVRALQLLLTLGLAVSFAANSAGIAMSLMCLSPRPPMWRPVQPAVGPCLSGL